MARITQKQLTALVTRIARFAGRPGEALILKKVAGGYSLYYLEVKRSLRSGFGQLTVSEVLKAEQMYYFLHGVISGYDMPKPDIP